MDHCDRWGTLLSLADSQALIDDVDRWCRRTGTNYNKLVVVAQVHVSARHAVRIQGKRITPKVANRLRQMMAAYPYGISRDEYRAKPKPWRREVVLPTIRLEPVRVSRETCFKCGAREGMCDHTVLSAYPARLRVSA